MLVMSVQEAFYFKIWSSKHLRISRYDSSYTIRIYSELQSMALFQLRCDHLLDFGDW
jgi:hypothetical protein